MSERSTDTIRIKLGILGVYLSCTVLGIALLAWIIVELSFHTWTIGQYFAGHGNRIFDVFFESFATAFLGIILSLFGNGRRRIIGAGAGMLTVLLVVIVFWMNQ